MVNILKEVTEVVFELERTNGKLAKQEILKRNEDNVPLRMVLEYTYDMFKVYGVGKKTIEEIESDKIKEVSFPILGIFPFLNSLRNRNLNTEIKGEIKYLLNKFDTDDEREIFKRILLKDLRIGMKPKTINEVYEGLLPTMDIMLAKKFEDRIDKLGNVEFIVTPKLDGIRCVLIAEEDNIKLITRQGRIIDGCDDIVEEARKWLPLNLFYDCELLAVNNENLNSKDLYQKTKKITGKKGKKEGLELHIFDVMKLDDFQRKINRVEARTRKDKLKTIEKEMYSEKTDGNPVYLKVVPIYAITNDVKEIKSLLDEVIDSGGEGLMLNTVDGFYDFKRSDNLLKVKKFYSIDLEIVGFEEGEGRNKGRLGAVLVDYKGHKVGVGSGFSDNDRDYIWENRDKLLGSIMEINYFEETKNQNGELSLRFPTFERLRYDKDEPSYD